MDEQQGQGVWISGIQSVSARRIGAHGKPDDSVPTTERQTELRTAYERNVAEGKQPYENVHIRTRGELTWVITERGWLEELRGGNSAPMNLSGADFTFANLPDVYLELARLTNTRFRYTDLSGAALDFADLSNADLYGANLSAANLEGAILTGANLRDTRLDTNTRLVDASLDSYTCLVDVVWNGVPVTRLNWQHIARLGNETAARNQSWHGPETIIQWRVQDAMRVTNRHADSSRGYLENYKPMARLLSYEDAVLANRQVATVLRNQGLNERADHFAYRAQMLQRRVLRLQHHYLRSFGSLVLDLTSGYGYKPMRSLIAYIVIIIAFTGAYLLNAQFAAPHLTWDEALVLSISAFHGRGFFTSGISLGDTLARLAAGEAIIGLLIEITFIATFTQRFFAR